MMEVMRSMNPNMSFLPPERNEEDEDEDDDATNLGD